jgi:hypothetical protein
MTQAKPKKSSPCAVCRSFTVTPSRTASGRFKAKTQARTPKRKAIKGKTRKPGQGNLF